MREYPCDLLEEHYLISNLVRDLIKRFKKHIIIVVIDPQSSLGFFKSLRYWVRKYPAFIIDGQEKIIGWNPDALNLALKTRLESKEV